MRLVFIGLIFTLLSAGCGSEMDSTAESLSYGLLSADTNTPENRLVFEEYSDDLLFAVGGSGFLTPGYEMGTFYPIKPHIDLVASALGVFQIELSLMQADKTPLVEDQLAWEYSLEKPAAPVVGFSEKATSDDIVFFQVSTARGPGVDELWVEGDLLVAPEGAWYQISADDRVQLQTTPDDGLKNFIVRLKNKYGNQSDETAALSILKKSIPPTDCSVIPLATTTNSEDLKIRISAVNNGPLYYQVRGDIVGIPLEKEFVGSVDATVELLPGSGSRTIRVQIRDQASNYCETVVLPSIEIDPAYEPAGIRLSEGNLWTDTSTISANIWYDHFPGQTVEMYLDGNIEESASTHKWIPLQSEVELKLNEANGNRFVNVSFRVQGEQTAAEKASIYLRPFVGLAGVTAPFTLALSNFIDLKSITIAGCSESYVEVKFANNYLCTPTGSEVAATYELADGTQVVRSASTP